MYCTGCGCFDRRIQYSTCTFRTVAYRGGRPFGIENNLAGALSTVVLVHAPNRDARKITFDLHIHTKRAKLVVFI